MPDSERRSIPLGWILATVLTTLVLGGLVVGIVAYLNLFRSLGIPVVIQVPTPFGNIILERDGVSFQRPPTFSKPGIEALEKHIERLTKSQGLTLDIWTEGNELTRFNLTPADAGIRARFALDPTLQSGIESKLRALFEELGEKPARIASDRFGITFLDYRIEGTPEQVAPVAERVLLEAYGVDPNAGLYFQFND